MILNNNSLFSLLWRTLLMLWSTDQLFFFTMKNQKISERKPWMAVDACCPDPHPPPTGATPPPSGDTTVSAGTDAPGTTGSGTPFCTKLCDVAGATTADECAACKPPFCRSPCDQVAGSEIRCHYNVENTIGLGAEGQCACSCFTPLTDARCPTTLGANPTHTCKGGPDDGACVNGCKGIAQTPGGQCDQIQARTGIKTVGDILAIMSRECGGSACDAGCFSPLSVRPFSDTGVLPPANS